jgi:hypothetical protein
MENKEKTNTEAPWWRDGVVVFTKVSAYIAVPIILASYIGQFLDNKYNTGNLYFYISIAIAFLTTLYLIWKEMKTYKKKMERDSNVEIKN